VVDGVRDRDKNLPPTLGIDYPYTVDWDCPKNFGGGGSMS